MSLGKLTLHCLHANLKRDVKSMRKMDPYALFVLGEQEWKTSTDERGSTKPKWKDQKHEFNVTYLGDDIRITLFDDDPGSDEKICYGTFKLSTFTEETLPEVPLTMLWKEKNVGTLVVRAEWCPDEKGMAKHEQEEEMGKAQELIKKLMARKKELEAEWETVQQILEDTKEEVQGLRDGLEQADCHAIYEGEVAGAEERHEREIARIEQNFVMAEQKGEDYKEARRAKVEKGEAYRDAKTAEYEAADTTADEAKEAKLARIEEMKENEEEEHAKELERLQAEKEEVLAADQEKYDAVAGEIHDIAEQLLEYNQKMQDYLTKLATL
jgi:hypothetical protein